MTHRDPICQDGQGGEGLHVGSPNPTLSVTIYLLSVACYLLPVIRCPLSVTSARQSSPPEIIDIDECGSPKSFFHLPHTYQFGS